MPVTIAIVGHTARREMAETLADDVQASVLLMDDSTIGCEGNHRRAWDWHTRHAPPPVRQPPVVFRGWTEPQPPRRPEPVPETHWAVTLEDDAMPIPRFRVQLDAALSVAPTPIVSLYLGTSNPKQWQASIARATDTADAAGAHWLTCTSLLHAVGIAIRTDLLPVQLDNDGPVDEQLTRWARTHGHLVAYCWPSLVDHADTEPLISRRADGQPRAEPRKAWRTGGRSKWTGRSVQLG